MAAAKPSQRVGDVARVSSNATRLSYQDSAVFFLITCLPGRSKLLVSRVPIKLIQFLSIVFVEGWALGVPYSYILADITLISLILK